MTSPAEHPAESGAAPAAETASAPGTAPRGESGEAGAAPAAGTGVPGPGVPDTGVPGPGVSGLRNPAAAVRGVGAGTLVMQALVLLLAIQPIRMLDGGLSGTTVAVIIGLAVAAVALAGLLRRDWAWPAGTGLQVVLLLAGVLHWSLAALAVVFGLVWGYVLHVRRRVLLDR